MLKTTVIASLVSFLVITLGTGIGMVYFYDTPDTRVYAIYLTFIAIFFPGTVFTILAIGEAAHDRNAMYTVLLKDWVDTYIRGKEASKKEEPNAEEAQGEDQANDEMKTVRRQPSRRCKKKKKKN